MIRKFLVSEDGPAAVEYAVLLALITIVAIPAVTLLGTEVRRVYEYVARELRRVVP